MGESLALHASAVLAGRRAVLIRGTSGQGKSTLARRLIEAQAGGFAALIGDDRVLLSLANGRLLVAPHPAIAGLLELRGHGLERRAHVGQAVVGLDVLLTDDEGERLPQEATVQHLGIAVPHLTLSRRHDAVAVVLAALAQRG